MSKAIRKRSRRGKTYRRGGGEADAPVFAFQSEAVIPTKYNENYRSGPHAVSPLAFSDDLINMVVAELKEKFDFSGLDTLTVQVDLHGEIVCDVNGENNITTVRTTTVPAGMTFYRLMINPIGSYGYGAEGRIDKHSSTIEKNMRKMNPETLEQFRATLEPVFIELFFGEVAKNRHDEYQSYLKKINLKRCEQLREKKKKLMAALGYVEQWGGSDDDGYETDSTVINDGYETDSTVIDDGYETDATVVNEPEPQQHLENELDKIRAEERKLFCARDTLTSKGKIESKRFGLYYMKNNFVRRGLAIEEFQGGDEVLDKDFQKDLGNRDFAERLMVRGLPARDGAGDEDINLMEMFQRLGSKYNLTMNSLFRIVEGLGIKNLILVDNSCSSMKSHVKDQKHISQWMRDRRLGGSRRRRRQRNGTRRKHRLLRSLNLVGSPAYATHHIAAKRKDAVERKK